MCEQTQLFFKGVYNLANYRIGPTNTFSPQSNSPIGFRFYFIYLKLYILFHMYFVFLQWKGMVYKDITLSEEHRLYSKY